MAVKSTIFKADLDISDLDRNYYQSHSLVLARHSSETDERMMVRLLAFALNAHEFLAFSEGMDNVDVPPLWQKDLTGVIEKWIEIGQPDEKRLLKACGRSDQVLVYCYASSAPIWWSQLSPKLERAKNLTVIHVPNIKPMVAHTERSMRFQCLIQDGQIWLTAGEDNFEIELVRLREASQR
jgi:uncharacterized protein YaeQ